MLAKEQHGKNVHDFVLPKIQTKFVFLNLTKPNAFITISLTGISNIYLIYCENIDDHSNSLFAFKFINLGRKKNVTVFPCFFFHVLFFWVD